MFLRKPTTDTLLCPRCDAVCALEFVNRLVPQFRIWVCSADKQHRFATGYEFIYEARRHPKPKPEPEPEPEPEPSPKPPASKPERPMREWPVREQPVPREARAPRQLPAFLSAFIESLRDKDR